MSRLARPGRLVMAAGVTAAVAAGPLAGSAAAAVGDFPSIVVSVSQEVRLAPGGQTTVPVTLDVKPGSNGGTVAGMASLTVTLSSWDRESLQITLPPPCALAPSKELWVCDFNTLPVGKTKIDMGIKSVGTPSGANSLISFRASSFAGAPSEATLNVAYSRPVPLAVTHPGREVTAKTGAQPAAPIGFQNVGTNAVSDAAVILEAGYGLDFAQRYANCRYGSPTPTRHLAVCSFGTAIQPGESFVLNGGGVTVAADAPQSGARLDYTVLRADDVSGYLGDGVVLTPGTGAPLTLTKSSDTAADRAQTAGTYLVVPEGQTSRVTAAPAAVKAPVGQVTELRAVVRNEGAASLVPTIDAERRLAAVVLLPKGVAVTKVADGCRLDDQADKLTGMPVHTPTGGSAYSCTIAADDVWKAGTERAFAFQVKATEPLAGARGSIVAVDYPRFETAEATFDTGDAGATSGGATGNTTGGTAGNAASTGGAAAGNQPGNGGPELAETGGSSSSTPVIAGVAGGLLVVAGGAFVVARRRKATAAV